MKGINPGSFYQLFGEGSCRLIIWGAQREHCMRGQICLVAGSVQQWDTYLWANEIPGGVTVICYHPPPPLTPFSSTNRGRLFMSAAVARGLAVHQGQDGCSRGWQPPHLAGSNETPLRMRMTIFHTEIQTGWESCQILWGITAGYARILYYT